MLNVVAESKRHSRRWLLLGIVCLGGGLTTTLCLGQAPAASPAPAADATHKIDDTWQGTLHIPQANRDLRIVVKVSKDDKGALKADTYSIDQPSPPLPADTASFENGVFKFAVQRVDAKFEGKMSGDGKSISGIFTQGAPIPLLLMRATPETEWVIPPPPPPVVPMAADANPGVEVATIKPSTPNRPGKQFGFRGREFIAMNTNLNDLIAFAYGLHSHQIADAPPWFGTELYDITAVPDVPGRPNLKQMGVMVQKLLADRFKLQFHKEKRELSVYAVELGSGGPKMTKTKLEPNDPQGFGFRGLGDLIVRNMNMTDFATWMQSGVMDKPVIDQTGLTDRYDFTLKWTPDESQFAQFRGVGAVPPPPSDDPNAPPTLYTALQEQLGLKMEAKKAPDDVIVIDHVEKPSAN